MEAIGILGLFFGLLAFLLSVYSVIKVKAWELSTHRVEYIKETSYPEAHAQAETLVAQPKVFDNLTGHNDDFDIDESGI